MVFDLFPGAHERPAEEFAGYYLTGENIKEYPNSIEARDPSDADHRVTHNKNALKET